MKISWPENKKFAFTIFDDTDNAIVENIKPVYDELFSLGIKTTKSVWVYPSRDGFSGASLQDPKYRQYVLDLKKKGFEIALHGVGSGAFTKEEIKKGLDQYKRIIGEYPTIHANHSQNIYNMYWGEKRFVFPLRQCYQLLSRKKFYGDQKESEYFWGDLHKEHIKYTRNKVFQHYNTLAVDPQMPYRNKKKPYTNYMFSSSDAHTVDEFLALTTEKNIDKLEQEGGAMIIYTHFASGFVDSTGKLHPEVKKRLQYIAKKSYASMTVGQLLDCLLSQKQKDYPVSYRYLLAQDMKWLIQRIVKKYKFSR